jgi:hypothetical protein
MPHPLYDNTKDYYPIGLKDSATLREDRAAIRVELDILFKEAGIRDIEIRDPDPALLASSAYHNGMTVERHICELWMHYLEHLAEHQGFELIPRDVSAMLMMADAAKRRLAC